MKYGLIGGKLGHSYSKIIHEMIGAYEYELHPLTKDEFDSFMTKKDFLGINVTIPYKQDVIPYLYHIDEKAARIGAVNTIVNHDGNLYGYNTDFDGFLYTIKKYEIEIEGKKVLVLGKGGASKAVLAVLSYLGASDILTVYYKESPGTITPSDAISLHADADVIVNTTPVGMYPDVDSSPIDLTPFTSLSAVLDVIYNPLETKLLKQANEQLGIKTASGLDMLSAQAVYASEYFQGKKLCGSEAEYVEFIDKITKSLM